MKLSTESIARASSRHPWRTLTAWFTLIISMGIVSSRLLGGVLSQDIEFTNRPESVKAQARIDEAFPGTQQGVDQVFFIVGGSSDSTSTSPDFQQKVREVQAAAVDLGREVVSGPPVSYLDLQAQAAQMFTPDLHGALIAVRLASDADPQATLARMRDALPSTAPDGYRIDVLTPEQVAAASMDSSEGASSTSAQPSANQPSAFVMVSSARAWKLDPGFVAAVANAQQQIVKTVGKALAAKPASGYDLQDQAASMVSADGRYALIATPLADNTDEIVTEVRNVAASASGGGFTVQVGGNPTLSTDFSKLAEQDLRRGEGIGLVIALIVLIVVFGAIVAALLPIVLAMFAIAVALGLVALIGQLFTFNLFVTNMVSMIGLAVGIDYSLFIVSRYREERKKGFEKLEAIDVAGATANRAVFFSGLTVVLALLGMFIIPTTIFRALAGGAILVTLVAIAASMTLLPALLALLGDRINWPRLSRRSRMGSSHDPQGGFWDRLSRRVMAQPVVFLVAGVLILGSLSAFYFQLHRGTTQNVSQLPDEFQSKGAFLTLQREFAGGTTDPVQIAVSGDIESSEVQAAVEDLRRRIAADPAFAETTMLSQGADGRTLLVQAFFRGDPSSDPAFQGIRDLRERIVPASFDGVPDAEVLVGGNTAFFTDFLDVVDRYQWIVLAFVLGLSFLLLMVVFRSIVVPIKAIIMNLLSVGAAYGAVTLVFQKGVGIPIFNDILQFQFVKVDAIEAWLPLFLFSVLFGLSMDYHVFLLTRIREEYDKTQDNTESVAYGLRTTAGLITGAAIIMVAVFTAFASGRIGALQQMGFGLAVAVFLDATIVRTILVPASMRLLGDANWYLPSWLEWLPKVNVEGRQPEQHVLVPELEPAVLDVADEEVVPVDDG